MPVKNRQTDRAFNVLFIMDAEDQNNSREGIERLNGDDHLIVTSGSALENRRCFSVPESFDAAVVDFQSDSFENSERILSRLNFDPAGREQMVLAAVPGSVSADERQFLLESGFDDCLVHPFSSPELVNKLRLFRRAEKAAGDSVVYKTKLEQAVGYLERYREKLSATGRELNEERHQLNNSLKQIRLMTGERKRLKEKIKSYGLKITESQEEFTRILAKLIEIRVEEDRGHSSRVAEAALFVAQQMALGKKEQETIRKAGLLHEIGMLLLPRELIDKEKPEPTEYEQDLLYQQPLKGAALLESCPGLEKVARTIRFLNEQVDGSGGPEGLTGRNIPAGSRIVAAADRFDGLRFLNADGGSQGWFSSLEDMAGSTLDPLVVHYLQKYAVTRLATDKSARMKGVGLHQLVPGMILGVSLFTAGGTKLFSADTRLDTAAIEKIMKYNRKYPVDETIYIRA